MGGCGFLLSHGLSRITLKRYNVSKNLRKCDFEIYFTKKKTKYSFLQFSNLQGVCVWFSGNACLPNWLFFSDAFALLYFFLIEL